MAFKIKTVKGKNTKQSANNLAKNLKQIGAGHFDIVYGRDDVEFVVKIGNQENIGYIGYLQSLAEYNGKNPYFPKIYDVTFFEDEKDENKFWYAVRMERLVHGWSSEYNDKFRKDVNTLIAIVCGTASGNEHLNSVYRVVRRALDISQCNTTDLHEGNMMLRGKQIVLIDPISC